MLKRCGCLLLLSSFALPQLLADRWPNWRGPHSTGVADSGNYPLEWSLDRHVLWQVTLPGPGASTPAVWDERIFLTSADGDRNALLCLDRQGGELWRAHIGELTGGKHRKATGCNSSPATNGTDVVAYFKSGDLACFDLEGQRVWHKNLQKEYAADTLWWDLGTSPLLADDLVIVTCQQSGPSYVVALDLATGAERWKQERSFPAPEESSQSYTTPCLAEVNGQRLLIVLGADHITAHRLTDGSEVWRVGGLNPDHNSYFRSISSPVIAGDLVIAPYARGETLTAVRPDGQGDVTTSHIEWQIEGQSADVPTPAYASGRLYVCSDKGTVHCLDAATGETKWTAELPRSRTAFSSSPVLANGRLYLTREDASTFVVDADTGELLATNQLEGTTVATPVFVDDRILVRTADQLFCLGEKEGDAR